jgi:DNA-binding transcriptional regulator YdaS (Cro superfamily)
MNSNPGKSKTVLKAVQRAVEKAGNQSKLARIAGCSPQIISDILRGQRSLTVEVAMKINEATGIPREELRPDVWRHA